MFYRSIRSMDLIDLRIFRPFSYSIWLCILFIILVLGIFLHLFIGLELKLVNTCKPKAQKIKNEKMESSILNVLGAFCQQGHELRINLLSGRYLVVFLFITSILIHDFYTSVLVSTLVELAPPAVRSLQDVANSELTVGFQETEYLKKFLNVINKFNCMIHARLTHIYNPNRLSKIPNTFISFKRKSVMTLTLVTHCI